MHCLVGFDEYLSLLLIALSLSYPAAEQRPVCVYSTYAGGNDKTTSDTDRICEF